MIESNKFKTLTELVKEARTQDKEALDSMEATKAAWKKANERLTERTKVLDDWVRSQINEATGIGSD